MRILSLDIDSLRPDHLGCYGYDRNTSPAIDRLAADGRRFTNYYAADAPCLPSRTGLFTGRFGVHTGVVNHGGRNADVRARGARREFDHYDEFRTWTAALQENGYRTALVSPFPERHAAFHVLDGFGEWRDTGGGGTETADVVAPHAESWLDAHATEDDWYLHVNFWDPHTLYTTPLEYGTPFEGEPPVEWLTENIVTEHREGTGPFCARDLYFYGEKAGGFPEAADERMPDEIGSREDALQFVDGYDTGVRYVDDHIGDLLDALDQAGVREETLVMLSADHGENLGEQNIYGDHVTADEATCRLPLIVTGPGVESGVDEDFHYQIDFGPTVADLAGIDPDTRWDGESFAASMADGTSVGREFLVIQNLAWTCQRSVRWDDWLLVRSYHDAYMDCEPVALFDLAADPHETTNLAADRSGIVAEGLAKLRSWEDDRLYEATRDTAGGNPDAPAGATDPLRTVLAEGGPFHPRGPEGVDRLGSYVERLRRTGREAHAERLERTGGFVTGDAADYLP